MFNPLTHTHCCGFLGDSVVKNPLANAGDTGDMDSILESGRSPGGGNSNPLQYCCLENPMEKPNGPQSMGLQRVKNLLVFFFHSVVFLLFFPFIFISWRLITLQYWSVFCHKLTCICHGFTRIPHPNPPTHLPLHTILLGLPSTPALSTCLMHPTWAGDLFHP